MMPKAKWGAARGRYGAVGSEKNRETNPINSNEVNQLAFRTGSVAGIRGDIPALRLQGRRRITKHGPWMTWSF